MLNILRTTQYFVFFCTLPYRFLTPDKFYTFKVFTSERNPYLCYIILTRKVFYNVLNKIFSIKFHVKTIIQVSALTINFNTLFTEES